MNREESRAGMSRALAALNALEDAALLEASMLLARVRDLHKPTGPIQKCRQCQPTIAGWPSRHRPHRLQRNRDHQGDDVSQFYVHQITYAGAESEFAVEDADGARLYRCDRFGVRLPDIDVGVTLEPLELGEWRLVDDAGREIGRARLDEPIFARVPSSTLLFAEYPR